MALGRNRPLLPLAAAALSTLLYQIPGRSDMARRKNHRERPCPESIWLNLRPSTFSYLLLVLSTLLSPLAPLGRGSQYSCVVSFLSLFLVLVFRSSCS